MTGYGREGQRAGIKTQEVFRRLRRSADQPNYRAGILIVNVLPCPGSLATVTVP